MSFKLIVLAATLLSNGPYFGEIPPRLEAKLFAPGLISTGLYEDGGLIITPDEKEVFVRVAEWPIGYYLRFFESDGTWNGPELASFSGNYWEGRMAAHPDGKRLFISSPRPLEGIGAAKDLDFWVLDKIEGGWSEPRHITGPLNSEFNEIDLTFSDSGNLYFHREGGPDHMDVFMSREVDGKFTKPEKIEIPGYQTFWEIAPMIAPDESYMVITTEGRPGPTGSLDLYVSFKNVDGSWSVPQNLGDKVNSPESDKLSSLSPDGKYMFWISDRAISENWSDQKLTLEELQELNHAPGNRRGDMYWVSTDVIEALRPK